MRKYGVARLLFRFVIAAAALSAAGGWAWSADVTGIQRHEGAVRGLAAALVTLDERQ